jgi:soluble lytic murein transglycosylase-like protein
LFATVKPLAPKSVLAAGPTSAPASSDSSAQGPQDESHAGAQGIAQFMPETATLRGLEDPFNPLEAIAKSAQLLRDLYRVGSGLQRGAFATG